VIDVALGAAIRERQDRRRAAGVRVLYRVGAAELPPTPIADRAQTLSSNVTSLDKRTRFDQREQARIIERTARAEGMPDRIIAAMIVNALAESYLDPTAKGDKGHSVGLFQLYDKGHGSGMSVEDRMDPVKNTTRIIAAARKAGTPVKGARAAWDTSPPLTAYKQGERDVATLSALWMVHVEQPVYSIQEEARRRTLAAKLSPEWSQRTSVPGTIGGMTTGSAAVTVLGALALVGFIGWAISQ
jgi:hypothetical protein